MKRSLTVVMTLVATLLLVGVLPAHAKPGRGHGGSAEVSVAFTCTSVDATSTKDLSNVVLEFEDGTTQRFEGLDGLTGSFSGTGEHEGKVVVRAWVKSGANHSGDGPGYGERFVNDTSTCTDGGEEPADPMCPDGFVFDPAYGCVPDFGGGIS